MKTMKRKRHNYDEEKDRLSDLFDCLLLRILSLLNTKQAVQTCILSTRWNNLWKHLSNLSLHSSYFNSMDGFTLANLTIQTIHEHNYRQIELYTPNLSAFAYAGTPFEKLCGSHLFSIKHVIIDAYMHGYSTKPPSNLLSWLKDFIEIESLTVTLTTLEVLSLVPNLLKDKLHSLHNLKSLQLMAGISSGLSTTVTRFVRLRTKYKKDVAKFREEIFPEGSLSIPDEIVAFLLQNSPSAKYHTIN